MGLRDRLSARFYMPLVSGVDAARRGGPLAPSVFTPGLEPGNPGDGDGGAQDRTDHAITRPSITSPAASATGVQPNATATSSAFASSNGQTHVKSRWVIEQRSDVAGPATRMLWWDSGPDATHKTSLPMVDADLGYGVTYAIKVRHKGSNGGWSAWSPYSRFTLRACGSTPLSCTQFRSQDGANWAEYAGIWRLTLAEVAVDLAAAETAHQNNGINYVGVVNGSSVRIYNPTFPAACTVPATCFLVRTLSTTTRTGLNCTTPDPCVILPADATPPTTPDPPIFVPPPSPPVDPVDPTDPDGYSNVHMNLATSLLTTLGTPKSLAEISAQGGVNVSWSQVTLQLAFDNPSTATDTMQFAVTCPGAEVVPSGLRDVEVDAHGTEVLPITINLPSNLTATYTLTIDTGELYSYTMRIGFTPPEAPTGF